MTNKFYMKKKNINRLLLHLIFFCLYSLFLTNIINAQGNKEVSVSALTKLFTEKYGTDQNLINGIKYYDPNPKAPGNAFFEPDEFSKGWIVINGKQYNDLDLKFDICRQNVVLSYSCNRGKEVLVLNKCAISEFCIKNKVFVKYILPGLPEGFYQEIKDGNITSLYYWHKKLIPRTNSLESAYEYSEQKRKSYLLINGQLFSYKNNRSYIRCFPEKAQKQIKEFVKEKHFNVKNITDINMKILLEFCNNQVIHEEE